MPEPDRQASSPNPRPVAQEPAAPIPVAYLMRVLVEELPEDAVVVEEALSSQGSVHEHLRAKKPLSYFNSASGGCSSPCPPPWGSSSRCRIGRWFVSWPTGPACTVCRPSGLRPVVARGWSSW